LIDTTLYARPTDKEEIEEYAKKIVENLKEYLPPRTTKLIRTLTPSLENARRSNHRRLIVVSGSDPVKVASTVARILLYYDRFCRRRGDTEISLLYIFHDEFTDAKIRKEIIKRAIKSKSHIIKPTIARYEGSERFLGTTFRVLVLDLVNDLKPNDVGRLVSIVEGKGLIIFMTPNWDEWDTKLTIFKQNLLIAGYNSPRHIFITWFKRKLREHNGIHIFNADDGEIIYSSDYKSELREKKEVKLPSDTLFPHEIYELALTNDQVNVLRKLEQLVDTPTRKKLAILITSDRGRGKSGAAGLASIALASTFKNRAPRVRIVVTAPDSSSTQAFFNLAIKAAEKLGHDIKVFKKRGNIIELKGKNYTIEYWSPIDATRIKADIVIVDEAAGIHVPLLHKIWRKHRRIVFATTIHGYEGAGRGFSVRFLPAIERDKNTKLIKVEMHEPIRYAEDDPIEKWLFDALLLNAEPAKLDEKSIADIEEQNLEYIKLDPTYLFSPEGEEILRQLFGIYVLAHYRNEPDDLALIADAPHHIVRAVLTKTTKKVVCALQIAQEGNLDEELIEELLRGGKTPGNIIPDRILKHLRIREFGRLKGWRIVRIATHPEVQGKGIGSFALKKFYDEAEEIGLDWVGSGFGVNEQLLKFWLKNSYLPIHMSPDRNPVSGEYTILVLKPVKKSTEKLVTIFNREFKLKLLETLSEPYNDLETEIAILVFKHGEPIERKSTLGLNEIQIDRLWIYAYGPMTYEAVADIIRKIARHYFASLPRKAEVQLSKREEHILLAKVLQGKSWENVAEELNTRSHTIMITLKEIARKILKQVYGIDEESSIGVTVDPNQWKID